MLFIFVWETKRKKTRNGSENSRNTGIDLLSQKGNYLPRQHVYGWQSRCGQQCLYSPFIPLKERKKESITVKEWQLSDTSPSQKSMLTPAYSQQVLIHSRQRTESCFSTSDKCYGGRHAFLCFCIWASSSNNLDETLQWPIPFIHQPSNCHVHALVATSVL